MKLTIEGTPEEISEYLKKLGNSTIYIPTYPYWNPQPIIYTSTTKPDENIKVEWTQ